MTSEIAAAIDRLRKWTEADYHRDGRGWLHQRDLTIVLKAAELHIQHRSINTRTTPV